MQELVGQRGEGAYFRRGLLSGQYGTNLYNDITPKFFTHNSLPSCTNPGGKDHERA
jgi:hypothetical protein